LSLCGVASPSLLNHCGVGLDCVEGHARAPKNLMSQMYMMAVELTTCRVPEDPASPIQAGDTSCHVRCSMSGDFTHAAFVTLCEANMVIEPHFNLWNYFFHGRLQQGLDVESVTLAVWTSSSHLGVELIPTSTS
jgi:hypothetical protein